MRRAFCIRSAPDQTQSHNSTAGPPLETRPVPDLDPTECPTAPPPLPQPTASIAGRDPAYFRVMNMVSEMARGRPRRDSRIARSAHLPQADGFAKPDAKAEWPGTDPSISPTGHPASRPTFATGLPRCDDLRPPCPPSTPRLDPRKPP